MADITPEPTAEEAAAIAAALAALWPRGGQRAATGAAPVGVAVQRSVVEPAGPGAPGVALDLRDRARSCRSS